VTVILRREKKAGQMGDQSGSFTKECTLRVYILGDWRNQAITLIDAFRTAIGLVCEIFHGRASYTMLKGVSVARRNRLKPAFVTTSRIRASPDCAPMHSPTSWDREHGVHRSVEKE
jgi:hypothetical protein